MAYYPPSYFDLTDLWNHFKAIALSEETEPSDKATIARVMIDIEVIRREIRGIPRLKAHSLHELPLKRARGARKPITIRDAAPAQDVTIATPESPGNLKESL